MPATGAGRNFHIGHSGVDNFAEMDMLRGMTSTAHQATATDAHQPPDLEMWREREGLAYEALGQIIGVSSAAQVRRYCIGERWPDPDVIERVTAATGGEVTVYALHRRRAAWMQANGGPRRVPVRQHGG